MINLSTGYFFIMAAKYLTKSNMRRKVCVSSESRGDRRSQWRRLSHRQLTVRHQERLLADEKAETDFLLLHLFMKSRTSA